MGEVIYDAAPQLADPKRFASAAARDLRASLPIALALLRSNLRSRYRRAWLGYAWLLLPALTGALTAMLVARHRLVEIPQTPIPYPAYVLLGIILWQLFTETLNAPIQHLAAARALVSRSPVPHEAIILAGALEALLNAALRLLLVGLPALLWAGCAPGGSAALLLLPLLGLSLLGLALGLFVAPLGLLYDDVGRVLQLATGLWFFLTPIVYPTRGAGLLRFNPVSPLLDSARAAMTGGDLSPSVLWLAAGSAMLLAVALLFYRLARPHVVARLG